MISDHINCADSMEPRVVNKTDDAVVGRKAPKYFFVCTGKWRGRGGLRTGQILEGISLLETMEDQIIILADSFSAPFSPARDNSVIFFFSLLWRRRRNLSGCRAKQMPVKLLTPFSRVKQSEPTFSACVRHTASLCGNRALYFGEFFGVWVILLYFILIINVGLISHKTSYF